MTRADSRYMIAATLIAALAAAACLAMFPLGAAAHTEPCGDRAGAVERLESKYGERVVFAGLAPAGAGAIFEVFAAESGTWTILRTHPSGRTCLVAAGTDARIEAAPAAGDPA